MALILLVVVLTGLLLGFAVSLVSLRNAAEERRSSLEYAASVVASSLVPLMMDEERERIEAQLQAILETSSGHEIVCIEILDAGGKVIAETNNGCTCDEVEPVRGLLGVFTHPQVVRVPLAVDGLKVATVSIQFEPVGLERALREPLQITLGILGLAMVVSAMWGGWLMLRTVVEPVEELRDAATRIAQGERHIALDSTRSDEIGQLASALNEMTHQLEQQERQIAASYTSLESAFHEKAELAQSLERAMSVKSDFVAVASHEIRSPLAVIRLYAEMLEGNEFGRLDPELAEAIDAIVSASARLSVIVRGLLDVALLERGVMPLEYAQVQLHEIVREATEDANAVAGETGIHVEIAGELPDILLRGDPVRLRQALDNLLSNAVKFSVAPATVTVELKDLGVVAEIDVADTGIGVPEDKADVLFELFGRADTSDAAPVSGLGLGLAIADRIARAHGGCIRFRPNPAGKGTVFTVVIPRSGADAGSPDEVRLV